MKSVSFDIREFREWLMKRGYDNLMGRENFEIYLENGLASLLFNNSSLLISFIFNKIGVSASERINERVKFEIGKKVKEIHAWEDRISIVLDVG
jgi:hypothetical protein